jgi:ribonuclease P protein component
MRVGLVVPRFKQSAVDRNRLKRRLRELARLRLLPTDIAADIVLRIRPDAYRASFEALATDIDRALTQLARWRPTVAEVATEATASETAERSTGLEG